MAVDCSIGRVLLLEQRVENLRGLLEEASDYLHDDPDDRGELGNLCCRIRQALGREEGDRS